VRVTIRSAVNVDWLQALSKFVKSYFGTSIYVESTKEREDMLACVLRISGTVLQEKEKVFEVEIVEAFDVHNFECL